jgi:dTDP-4-amino-4,6-dideoxygalactose transaminase
MKQDNIEVPFNNLSLQWQAIEQKFMPELQELINNSQFCLGPAVENFEQEFADYMGASHAIGVNSGTSALHLALIAAGIGRGDKVLIPNYTFVATAWAVMYVGAIPILCDVEPETGNISIVDAEKRIEPGTKAIIPVHLYGQPANLDAILAFAKRHNLTLIEDACQAHGASYQQKRVGTYGRFGCFSFYPGKNLGAFGEAGMIITDDSSVVDRLKALRHHSQHERYLHAELGFNYRMEGIQGLVLSHKLKHLDNWTNERRQIAKRYITELSDLPISLPLIVHDDHVYHLFVIRTTQREKLSQWLNSRGISTGLHYPVPLHRQPCLQYLESDQQSFPVSDYYAEHGLSLPIFPGMLEKQINAVISEIRSFFGASS